MTKKVTDKPLVSQMSDTDSVLGVFGGKMSRMSIPDFRSHLNDNDNQVLNELAFYIDVNSPSSLGSTYSTRVDVGGNMHMRAIWEAAHVDILMDKNGNYCELNPKDCRYTAEGEAVVDLTNNAILAKWQNCDMMKIIPLTYGHIQTVQIGASTRQRLWLSLVPLPNGYIIPQQVVGKFKAGNVSGAMRSLPNMTPDNSKTINAFWNCAQTRSKSHGLANLDFRNALLFYMMSKYGYRDSQNCKGGDGTLVWGVGLDGSEGLASGETINENGFTNQKNVKTGATLSLGKYDGNVSVTLSNGNTAHGVNVNGFENPWGQYWEMIGGLCSVGTKVFFWRGNFIPSTASNPTEATFTNVDHVVLKRKTSNGLGNMNIIASEDGQGCYMIPMDDSSNTSYGDNYWYKASGQLWLWGGASADASTCGLADSHSSSEWAASSSGISARLAYYGDIKKVSPSELARLSA